jgi:hypothetical protein
MSELKVKARKAEVQQLLDAGFIREVSYPQWLANIVDFSDLEKCCHKDDSPLVRIDKIMDSTAGCNIMALLDCFSGYQQLWLRREDEEKTSFIPPFRTYCYLKMSERLPNAGPTFCKMNKAALKDQVGRNVRSYIDDIVVVSKQKASYIFDLVETFANMHEPKLKLNPEKCVFGVTRGKVLGCLVSTKGIEANPDKKQAILQMQPPQTKREVPKLMGRIAALNRFIAKLAERSLPFFSALTGSAKME